MVTGKMDGYDCYIAQYEALGLLPEPYANAASGISHSNQDIHGVLKRLVQLHESSVENVVNSGVDNIWTDMVWTKIAC